MSVYYLMFYCTYGEGVHLHAWFTISLIITNVKCNICACLLGFHLSASVHLSTTVQTSVKHNVAVTFDRRRITSCNCTCNSGAYWCSHIVAVCLYRIHQVSS